MLKFKVLAGILVTVMAGAAIWWFVTARAHEALVEAWFENRREAGWQAEAGISVAGFPNRLDVTLTDLALADPQSGWAWSAPQVEIDQIIYDPTFYVMTWPAEQIVAAPGARAVLRSGRMQASFRAQRSTSLGLERVSVDIENAALAADAGWTAGAEKLSAHVLAAPDAGPENAYQFRLDGVRLRMPDFLRATLDPAGALPAALETLTLDGRAALDKPLDRFALEGEKPDILAFSLNEARAEWGPLKLLVSGATKADAAGYAEGEFDIAATNWREMLDAAVAAGGVPAGLADTLRSGLGFLAGLGGDPDQLDVTLTLSGGLARIGPVPVGAAPRMVD
ncbi:MAG: DUF2125 domain-containing protein [Pikeienuella sp.]